MGSSEPSSQGSAPTLVLPAADDPASDAGLSESVRHLTRAGEWWSSLVGLLLGVAYLQILFADLSPADAAVKLVALVVSCALLAGYANVLNDLTDIEQDGASGRSTGVMRLGRPISTVLVVALALAGLVPWFFVSISPAAWVALAGIVGLPLAYSLPGIRLKERGGIGIITDALFEHAFPTAFVILLFRPDRDTAAITTAIDVALVIGSFATGLRGIIGHQLLDEEKDRVAGVRSWVQRVGAEHGTAVLRRQVFPVEVASLIVVVALAYAVAPLVAVLATISALLLLEARRVGAWERTLRPEPSSDPEVRWVLWKYYRLWPALFVLVALVVQDPWYLLLVGAHLVMFRKAARDEFSSVWFYGRELVRRLIERSSIRVGRAWNQTRGWWLRTRGRVTNAVKAFMLRWGGHLRGWWLRTRGVLLNAPMALRERLRRGWVSVGQVLTALGQMFVALGQKLNAAGAGIARVGQRAARIPRKVQRRLARSR